jgi:hypothetical protein
VYIHDLLGCHQLEEGLKNQTWWEIYHQRWLSHISCNEISNITRAPIGTYHGDEIYIYVYIYTVYGTYEVYRRDIL